MDYDREDAMHVHIAYRPGDGLESAASPLTLDSRRHDAGLVITVLGEVDMTSAAVLEEYVREQAAPGERVVLDLTMLTFMDSNGLRACESLHNALRDGGGSLRLTGVHGVLVRLLEITGLREVLDIHGGPAGDALAGRCGP
ncbi:STAS domain-containing protein [Nonomuraea salmonea]|jgi:anti-anti-sigma factor|uniref:Anti-sigma factor antagonist n=1 Tax=Nonomuraea salmonea TaxID=46181 RepID=A0ABV5P1T6_9ACTN